MQANKIVFVSDKSGGVAKGPEQVAKEVQALKTKMTMFKDAEVHTGFTGAAEALKGKVVLAEYLPLNLVAAADSFVECSTAQGVNDTIKKMLTADQIAEAMVFVKIFKSEEVNFALWKTENETQTAEVTATTPEGENTDAE